MKNRFLAGFGAAVIVGCFTLVSSISASEKDIVLPKPKASCNVDVMKAFQERKSIREFEKKDIPIENLATVLWAGYGLNRGIGKHTVPTAMGKDLLDLFVVRDDGVYSYDSIHHALIFISDENIKGKISKQAFASDAPAIIVLVGKPNAFSASTLTDARMAFVNFTAGCTSQNIYLACASLDLGTVVMAYINKDVLTNGLKLKEGRIPLYIMPIGYPK